MKINGAKVLGNTDQLNELIAKHGVECVLIAIPSAQGPEIAQIVHKVRECRVEFKILPTISDLIDKPSYGGESGAQIAPGRSFEPPSGAA